jgi:triosephosphate isomerase
MPDPYRLPLIAGNWKMHKTLAESVETVRAILTGLRAPPEREAVVCPPFTALAAVFEVLKDSPVRLGAQDMHPAPSGAFTGEISAAMLLDAGCRYVILGHSERRRLFGETDVAVGEKVRGALAAGLKPIACVGETLEEREGQKTFRVIERQLAEILNGLAPTQAASLVIAYEPVWAIGTGRTAQPHQAQEVHLFIRKRIAETLGKEAAGSVRILYGGSVKTDNIDALMAEPDLDGALVGGESLKAESFLRIIAYRAPSVKR